MTNFVCSVVRMEAMVGEKQLRQGGDEAWIGGTRLRSRRARTQGAVCTVMTRGEVGIYRVLEYEMCVFVEQGRLRSNLLRTVGEQLLPAG